jgi:hypothetical protein
VSLAVVVTGLLLIGVLWTVNNVKQEDCAAAVQACFWLGLSLACFLWLFHSFFPGAFWFLVALAATGVSVAFGVR